MKYTVRSTDATTTDEVAAQSFHVTDEGDLVFIGDGGEESSRYAAGDWGNVSEVAPDISPLHPGGPTMASPSGDQEVVTGIAAGVPASPSNPVDAPTTQEVKDAAVANGDIPVTEASSTPAPDTTAPSSSGVTEPLPTEVVVSQDGTATDAATTPPASSY